MRKELAKKVTISQGKLNVQAALLQGKDDLLKGKEYLLFLKHVLLKGKEDLLDEKARNQKLAAKVIEGKEAAISGLKMELLRAKGLLSARGIFEKIMQLIHEETPSLKGRFNATAVCANIATHKPSDGNYFLIIELRRI
jgi:hypothetical protein